MRKRTLQVKSEEFFALQVKLAGAKTFDKSDQQQLLMAISERLCTDAEFRFRCANKSWNSSIASANEMIKVLQRKISGCDLGLLAFMDDEEVEGKSFVNLEKREINPKFVVLQLFAWSASDVDVIDLAKSLKASLQAIKGRRTSLEKKAENLNKWLSSSLDVQLKYRPAWVTTLQARHMEPEKIKSIIEFALMHQWAEVERFKKSWLFDVFFKQNVRAKTPFQVYFPWYMKQLNTLINGMTQGHTAANSALDKILSALGSQVSVKDLGKLKLSQMQKFNAEFPSDPIHVWTKLNRLNASLKIFNNAG